MRPAHEQARSGSLNARVIAHRGRPALYASSVSSDLWFGAVTTLAGAALGGLISYLLSRQQIREARAQRGDTERWDRARRSEQRRFEVYADFLTHARQYRNAIRPSERQESGPRLPLHEIDALARSADAAGSLVFLVNESLPTQQACSDVMRTIGTTVQALHDLGSDPGNVPWDKLGEDMALVLRNFQAAARAELHLTAVESSAARSI